MQRISIGLKVMIPFSKLKIFTSPIGSISSPSNLERILLFPEKQLPTTIIFGNLIES